ncbi:hypothetical protein B484DRAFT_109112 [Ochromonadaceae sp. CCMP2298]|nr:hypothetical protein B484DRAFT_109112 [Ochromonadaceae sp. CCMP2298]
MTTTGYGDQIPQYEWGRFVACFIMLFGTLFLSMPLAIIGNEYEHAWDSIQDEVEKEKAGEQGRRRSALIKLMDRSPGSPSPGSPGFESPGSPSPGSPEFGSPSFGSMDKREGESVGVGVGVGRWVRIRM